MIDVIPIYFEIINFFDVCNQANLDFLKLRYDNYLIQIPKDYLTDCINKGVKSFSLKSLDKFLEVRVSQIKLDETWSFKFYHFLKENRPKAYKELILLIKEKMKEQAKKEADFYAKNPEWTAGTAQLLINNGQLPKNATINWQPDIPIKKVEQIIASGNFDISFHKIMSKFHSYHIFALTIKDEPGIIAKIHADYKGQIKCLENKNNIETAKAVYEMITANNKSVKTNKSSDNKIMLKNECRILYLWLEFRKTEKNIKDIQPKLVCFATKENVIKFTDSKDCFETLKKFPALKEHKQKLKDIVSFNGNLQFYEELKESDIPKIYDALTKK